MKKEKKGKKGKGTTAPEAVGKLGRTAYENELARLHGELVQLQEWVVAKGLKVCIVFEGRDAAGKGGTIKAHHRAGQPAGVPGRRAARADRAREVADVRPALPAALPGRRRGRHLRPQLVQPGRRRAGDGLLHRASRPNGSSSWCRPSRRRWSTPGSSCSSTGSRSARRSRPAGSRAASTTAARSGSSRPWTSSPTAAGTTTPGPATRCSRPPTPPGRPGIVADSDDKKRARLNIISHLLQPDSLQGNDARKGETAETERSGKSTRHRLPVQVHPGEVLTDKQAPDLSGQNSTAGREATRSAGRPWPSARSAAWAGFPRIVPSPSMRTGLAGRAGAGATALRAHAAPGGRLPLAGKTVRNLSGQRATGFARPFPHLTSTTHLATTTGAPLYAHPHTTGRNNTASDCRGQPGPALSSRAGHAVQVRTGGLSFRPHCRPVGGRRLPAGGHRLCRNRRRPGRVRHLFRRAAAHRLCPGGLIAPADHRSGRGHLPHGRLRPRAAGRR